MTDRLTDLLKEREWLLADGATGTNLFNMGLSAGESPEFWNVDHQERVRRLYSGWVDAGSDIFLTNTFGGNAARLKLHDGQSRVRELNLAGAEIARETAERSGRRIVVAGSMGPTGEIMEPMGSLSQETAIEIFHEQAEALRDGGVDVLWVETISAPEEYRAASEAARLAGMPWCGTMSFDTAGRTMMGLTSQGFVDLIARLPYPPLAFGANCGVGASDLVRTVIGFAAQGSEVPIIAKGNAGIPKYVEGHIHYDGTPELMSEYAVLARDAGARIIGGCCGTTPAHLAMMREALEQRPAAERPTLDAVVAALGPFSSPSDGTGPDAAEPPARRGRRRRRG